MIHFFLGFVITQIVLFLIITAIALGLVWPLIWGGIKDALLPGIILSLWYVRRAANFISVINNQSNHDDDHQKNTIISKITIIVTVHASAAIVITIIVLSYYHSLHDHHPLLSPASLIAP